ncbi:MAG: helix-turn-helix domain-containing protein [Dysgonomonas sp.]
MGLRIKEILKEKGIAIKDFTVMMELTAPSVSNFINGKSKPSIDVFERAARVLDIPISDLFERPKENIIICPKCGTKLEVKEKSEK